LKIRIHGQLADGFTKGLAKEKYNIFIQGMNLKEIK
jgi:hypothetical protein